jgi:hypothetical protein
MGVAQNVVTIYWYVDGNDAFLQWITAVADEDDPPQSNSISWGSIEQVFSAYIFKYYNCALDGVKCVSDDNLIRLLKMHECVNA